MKIEKNKKNEDLFKIFQLIKETSLDEKKKKIIIRALFVAEEWSWVVCGISKKSLEIIEKKEFEKPSNTLQRHHFKTFNTTVEKLLSKDLNFEKWSKIIEEGEKTHILTKDEHGMKQDYEFYEIPLKKGLFKNLSRSFNFSNKEKDFLRKIRKSDFKVQKFEE